MTTLKDALCEFIEIEEPDERGLRKTQCIKCGYTTGKHKLKLEDAKRVCDEYRKKLGKTPKSDMIRRIIHIHMGEGISDEEIEREVPELDKNMIALWKRYKESTKIWESAGKPLRSDEDIARIYDEHCQPCEHRQKSRCGICGCFLKRVGTKLNKIARATDRCPLEPPKWDADIIVDEAMFAKDGSVKTVAPPRLVPEERKKAAKKKRSCCGG